MNDMSSLQRESHWSAFLVWVITSFCLIVSITKVVLYTIQCSMSLFGLDPLKIHYLNLTYDSAGLYGGERKTALSLPSEADLAEMQLYNDVMNAPHVSHQERELKHQASGINEPQSGAKIVQYTRQGMGL